VPPDPGVDDIYRVVPQFSAVADAAAAWFGEHEIPYVNMSRSPQAQGGAVGRPSRTIQVRHLYLRITPADYDNETTWEFSYTGTNPTDG
jgi:hypothetical protein